MEQKMVCFNSWIEIFIWRACRSFFSMNSYGWRCRFSWCTLWSECRLVNIHCLHNLFDFLVEFYRLEPLLLRIKQKRSAILCPSIDMISDQNMAYSVKRTCSIIFCLNWNWFCFFRAQAQVVLVVFGGHYISIGFQYRIEFVKHNNLEQILIRRFFFLLLLDNLMDFLRYLVRQQWPADFLQHIENISSKLVAMVNS